jgi:hypothetical protein
MVKNTGDGFLLEFSERSRSIEAAIGDANLMAERNAQLPAEWVMRFRMGVHMGDVIADEAKCSGMTSISPSASIGRHSRRRRRFGQGLSGSRPAHLHRC